MVGASGAITGVLYPFVPGSHYQWIARLLAIVVLGAGKGVPSHHKHMSKTKTLESFPDGKKGHIQGAIKFYEGQLDDARHTMALSRTAAE